MNNSQNCRWPDFILNYNYRSLTEDVPFPSFHSLIPSSAQCWKSQETQNWSSKVCKAKTCKVSRQIKQLLADILSFVSFALKYVITSNILII